MAPYRPGQFQLDKNMADLAGSKPAGADEIVERDRRRAEQIEQDSARIGRAACPTG